MDTQNPDGTSETQATLAPAVSFRRREAANASRGSAHVLILAGGDGLRLRTLTRALCGDDRPKQFCALTGPEPMLVQAERRAALIAPPEQVMIALTRRHRTWYRELVSGIPMHSLVIQPVNRGTATAVLYGLLRIATRTPNAPVVILPSDQWVSSDSAFMLYAQAAVGFVEAHPNAVVLLGAPPTRPEDEYGWIEPGEPVLGEWRGLSRVAGFVEKPSPEEAEDLKRRGTMLWNTSVVVGQVEQLLLLLAMGRPALVDSFLEIWPALGSAQEAGAIEHLYERLEPADFSRDVLAAQPDALSVLAVRGPVWEDVGHLRGLMEARRLQSILPPQRSQRRASDGGARPGRRQM